MIISYDNINYIILIIKVWIYELNDMQKKTNDNDNKLRLLSIEFTSMLLVLINNNLCYGWLKKE